MPKPKKSPSVDTLHQKIQDLESKWKRALADYQNLEKRVSQGQNEFVKFANASLIDKLLTILDDLERALAHTQDKGLKLIVNQFKNVLESEGVAQVQAINQPFNPETMDATDMVPGKKNTVIKVIAKGYTLNDKVLRPAKVQVGSGQSK